MQEVGRVLAARGVVDGAGVAALVGITRELDGPGVHACVEAELAVLDLELAVLLPGAHGHGAHGALRHLAVRELAARGHLPGLVQLDQGPHLEVGPLAGELAAREAARVLGVVDQPDLHVALPGFADGHLDHLPPAVGEVFIGEIVARLDVDHARVHALHQVQVLLHDLGVHRALPAPEDVAGVLCRRQLVALFEGGHVAVVDAIPALDQRLGRRAETQREEETSGEKSFSHIGG